MVVAPAEVGERSARWRFGHRSRRGREPPAAAHLVPAHPQGLRARPAALPLLRIAARDRRLRGRLGLSPAPADPPGLRAPTAGALRPRAAPRHGTPPRSRL